MTPSSRHPRQVRRSDEAATPPSVQPILSSVLEASQEGFLVLTAQGRIHYYSTRLAELWGLPDWEPSATADEAILQTIAKQLRDPETWMRQFRNPGSTEIARRATRMPLADGRMFEARSAPATFPDGDTGITWSFLDVTAAVEAEKALQESEQFLAVHFSRTPLASIAWDPDFCVLEWNPAAELIFGYSKEEAVGRSALDLIVPPDVRPRISDVFQNLLNGEMTSRVVNENVTKDGRVILCEWHNTRLVDLDGRVMGVASFAQDITERQQAQEELRLSEERYRELCNSLPQTIFEIDSSGTVTFFNESAVEMFGYSREELGNGFSAFEILTPEDRTRAAENTRRVVSGEMLLGIEYTAQRKNGSRMPILINGSAITKGGSAVGLRGVVTDLTQQKKAEAALEARLSFERLVANLSANFINLPASRIDAELGRALRTVGRWLHADRSYIFIQDETRGILRLDHEFPGPGARSITQLTGPIPSGRFHRLLHRLADGAPVLVADVEAIDPDWVQERQFFHELGTRSTALVPLLIGGSAYGLVGFDYVHRSQNWSEEMALQLRLLGEVFSSALDRKRAEEALIKSETKYRNLLESSGLAVSFIDDEGRYSIVNQTAASYIGKAPEDIIGRHINEIYKGERAKDYLRRFDSVLKTGSSQTSEDQLRLPDGPHWFWTILHPVYEPEGRFLGIQVVSHDITERKEAEEELGQLEEQLIHARKMEAIGNLAGGIAHDFNNLLTGVMGYANVLRLRAHSPDEVQEAAAIIEKTAERASQLTKQLLGFARKGKLQEVTFDFHTTVEDVIALLSRTLDRSIVIEKRFNAHRSRIQGDPTQMQQVVLNLAVNARDAMPRGGRLTFHTDTVEFRAESSWRLTGAAPGPYLIFSVSDTGSGIPAEIRDRVFEPFFTTKSSGTGTGMGLATVYGIVKNHGGVVRLTSETGTGTTFKVFLPIVESAQVVDLAPIRTETAVHGKGRVLVVDDEEVVRNLARKMLMELGYEVVCAEDGEQAIACYGRGPGEIDLVLLDMIMPLMGGKDCIRELRRIDPSVVAVLTTGFSSDAEIREIMKEGWAGFIQKPYRADELSRVIKEALQRGARGRAGA